jgi:hypothetical protein
MAIEMGSSGRSHDQANQPGAKVKRVKKTRRV